MARHILNLDGNSLTHPGEIQPGGTGVDAQEMFTQLDSRVHGDVCLDQDSLKSLEKDASHICIKPKLGIFPRHSADIQEVVRFALEQKKIHPDLALAPRAAGMCVSGGPLSDSIVLDVNRHMNHMVQLTEESAVVQPGMRYRDFDYATKALGRFLPSYPASRDACCVGGMVGNNSGGPKTFAHGKTADFVQRLKVVLADGHEYTLEPLNKEQLASKLKQETFEGQLYRKLYELIEQNYELIQSAKPRVSKNSAGYYLWNVWDRDKGVFDLTQLFTGSQATLGIVTEITFRLVRFRPKHKLMVVFLDDVSKLTELVHILSEERPEELEMYHQSVMRVIMRHYPTFAQTLEVNPFSFGFQFHQELLELIKDGPMIPEFLILPKFVGESEEEVDRAIDKAHRAIKKFNLPVHITETQADREKYRKLRHDSFFFFQNHLGGKEEIVFFDDLCVPVEHLSRYVPKLLKTIQKAEAEFFMAGHIGNGNIHLVPFMDPTDPKDQQRIKDITDELYAATLEIGGSISGEHNDGLTRTPYIPQMYGAEVYALFEETKRIFDPQSIFNPGKKIINEKTRNLQYAFDHMLPP